jgi:hypothetical protein
MEDYKKSSVNDAEILHFHVNVCTLRMSYCESDRESKLKKKRFVIALTSHIYQQPLIVSVDTTRGRRGG